MNSAPAPNRIVLIIGMAGLIWNFAGLIAVLADMIGANNGSMTEAQRVAEAAMPLWSQIGGLVGVFCGIAGCIALIMRNGFAISFLAVSLLGIILQEAGIFVFAYTPGSIDKAAMVVQTSIFLVAVSLLAFARKARRVGLLS